MGPMDLTVVAPRCHCGHLLNAWSKPPGQPFPRRYCPDHPPQKKRKKHRRRTCGMHGGKLPCLACASAAKATAVALASTERVAGGVRAAVKPKSASTPQISRGSRERRLVEPLHLNAMRGRE